MFNNTVVALAKYNTVHIKLAISLYRKSPKHKRVLVKVKFITLKHTQTIKIFPYVH